MAADPVPMTHVEHHSIPLFRCLDVCRTPLVILLSVCVCACVVCGGSVCLSVLFLYIDLWLSLV